MEFCSDCGTLLRRKGEGMWCSKCRKLTHPGAGTDVRTAEGDRADSVYVLDQQESGVREVTRTCPECRNDKAYQWFSSVSGEHAGVGRERTVEHYRCTRCAHSWSESR